MVSPKVSSPYTPRTRMGGTAALALRISTCRYLHLACTCTCKQAKAHNHTHSRLVLTSPCFFFQLFFSPTKISASPHRRSPAAPSRLAVVLPELSFASDARLVYRSTLYSVSYFGSFIRPRNPLPQAERLVRRLCFLSSGLRHEGALKYLCHLVSPC